MASRRWASFHSRPAPSAASRRLSATLGVTHLNCCSASQVHASLRNRPLALPPQLVSAVLRRRHASPAPCRFLQAVSGPAARPFHLRKLDAVTLLRPALRDRLLDLTLRWSGCSSWSAIGRLHQLLQVAALQSLGASRLNSPPMNASSTIAIRIGEVIQPMDVARATARDPFRGHSSAWTGSFRPSCHSLSALRAQLHIKVRSRVRL